MDKVSLKIPSERIAEFCRRWRIQELSVFGSALRSDFNPDSDIDILVTFASSADWSLLDHIRMDAELGEVFGRDVDLISKRAIERSDNWLRRKAILESAEVIYAA